MEQTARFGCTVTVLFNTHRDTKETEIKMEKSTRHASNTPNERAGDRPDIVFPLLALKFATTIYGGRNQAVHDDGHANVFVLPPRTKSFFFEYRSPPLYSLQINRNFPRASSIFSLLLHDLFQRRFQSLQLLYLTWNTKSNSSFEMYR